MKINDHHTQNNRLPYLLDWFGVRRDWDAGCGAGGRNFNGGLKMIDSNDYKNAQSKFEGMDEEETIIHLLALLNHYCDVTSSPLDSAHELMDGLENDLKEMLFKEFMGYPSANAGF
jgi:hypothetical protein